jgi:hypothetical protein
MSLSLDHYVAWKSISHHVRELWSPSKVGSFKVSFDTTTKDHFSVQAATYRNSHGTIIKSLCQFNLPCDPTYGEAQAALLVVSLATTLKLDNFVLGVSSLVISSLQQHSIVLD